MYLWIHTKSLSNALLIFIFILTCVNLIFPGITLLCGHRYSSWLSASSFIIGCIALTEISAAILFSTPDGRARVKAAVQAQNNDVAASWIDDNMSAAAGIFYGIALIHTLVLLANYCQARTLDQAEFQQQVDTPLLHPTREETREAAAARYKEKHADLYAKYRSGPAV